MTSTKSSCWSITINNPTEEDHNSLELLKSFNWFKSWKGQLEEGTNNTPHIQGMLKTEHIRFSAVKKAIPRAHIEAARNATALERYVQKEETRVAGLPEVKAITPTDLYRECMLYVYNDLCTVTREWSVDEWFTDPDHEDERIRERWNSYNGLDILDSVTRRLIENGARLEMYSSNPAVRSSYERFFCSMIIRDAREYISNRAQNQTDECADSREATSSTQTSSSQNDRRISTDSSTKISQ